MNKEGEDRDGREQGKEWRMRERGITKIMGKDRGRVKKEGGTGNRGL